MNVASMLSNAVARHQSYFSCACDSFDCCQWLLMQRNCLHVWSLWRRAGAAARLLSFLSHLDQPNHARERPYVPTRFLIVSLPRSPPMRAARSGFGGRILVHTACGEVRNNKVRSWPAHTVASHKGEQHAVVLTSLSPLPPTSVGLDSRRKCMLATRGHFYSFGMLHSGRGTTESGDEPESATWKWSRRVRYARWRRPLWSLRL